MREGRRLENCPPRPVPLSQSACLSLQQCVSVCSVQLSGKQRLSRVRMPAQSTAFQTCFLQMPFYSFPWKTALNIFREMRHLLLPGVNNRAAYSSMPLSLSQAFHSLKMQAVTKITTRQATKRPGRMCALLWWCVEGGRGERINCLAPSLPSACLTEPLQACRR